MNIIEYKDSTFEEIGRARLDDALIEIRSTVLPPSGATMEKLARAEQKPDPMESAFAEWSEIAVTGKVNPAPRLRSERRGDPDRDPNAFRPDLGDEVDDDGDIIRK